MTIDDLIYSYSNDHSFKNKLQTELKNKKSKYNDQEVIKHKKEVINLRYKLMLDLILNEIYPVVSEIRIR